MTSTTTSTSRLEMVAFGFFAAGVSLIQFNIRAEGLLVVAAIAWGMLAWQERVRPSVPAFFLPLLCLAAVTVVGASLSADPIYSAERLKQLLLFLIVPLAMRVATGKRATQTIDIIIALGALSALIGILQWAALGYDEAKRPRGLLNHWMTYSGLLMLVVNAAIARLLYAKRDWIWPAVAVPSLLVALISSYTRNAYVGTAAGLGAMLSLKDKRYLLALPVGILLIGFAAPASIRSRALSSFDPNDPTNRDRIAMWTAGVAMVKDHPLFGVGLNMVPKTYLHYRTSDARDSDGATEPETRSHLHNVPMQIAAERGLIALGCFFWFVIVAARDLYRLVQRSTSPAVAAAGFAAIVAMLVAGLFEHNFGDSEFLIMLLVMITLPFAAEERTHA